MGILSSNKTLVDTYIEHTLFKPYNINIKRCVPESKIDDAKRLFDFSFTTRKGGQNKEALRKYRQAEPAIRKVLSNVLEILKGSGDPKNKYLSSLALIHNIDGVEGIGQKIATMFLKFLVYYSEDFPGKDDLIQELLIPFDAHVMKLLFSKVNGKDVSRLNLYPDEVNQATLHYDFQVEQDKFTVTLKNELFRLQQNIREDFVSLNIMEPPIILDYLWYVGANYCTHSELSAISCKICFLKGECETGLLRIG
ncbi:hypothetical protein M1N59_00870 [Dehalococcoidales bacterium]|nr:hypothetical protein [Dehalococcoidales bacterium]